ncbi:MAG TPA: hypothetical protein VGG64_06550 [Pirellulales bacterium]
MAKKKATRRIIEKPHSKTRPEQAVADPNTEFDRYLLGMSHSGWVEKHLDLLSRRVETYDERCIGQGRNLLGTIKQALVGADDRGRTIFTLTVALVGLPQIMDLHTREKARISGGATTRKKASKMHSLIKKAAAVIRSKDPKASAEVIHRQITSRRIDFGFTKGDKIPKSRTIQSILKVHSDAAQ